MKHSLRAFSLVELSIVLVILGLLVGGVLTGQSLIRAAEIRAISTEYSKYKSAAMTFRDKYIALAGDMTNATAFWGHADTSGADGSCGSPESDTGSGTETCNGDGDGTLDMDTSIEPLRMWQHLANAGLIEGTYTGVDPDAGSDGDYYDVVIGDNAPFSKLGSSIGWAAYNIGPASGHGIFFDGNYGNSLNFGGSDGGNLPNAAALSPEEAWNVDTKMDDGLPAQGSVVVRYNMSSCTDQADGTDAATSSDLDAVFELDTTSLACVLVFKNFY